jgi:class 3 adenylate cyclase/tetratricopeptide (TPR) repeat protein
VIEPDHQRTIDGLLDRAIQAINRGDRVTATGLAGRVLAVDRGNQDAEDLLAAPLKGGEIRRLTILFCDLVDSTVLATRIEPETYRTIVGRYRDQVQRNVDRYEGHIGSPKGDGLLAVFGYPRAHDNDVRRAVQAGLDITRDVARLCEQTRRRFGVEISVRVGVHRGLVYLDTAQDDVYGFAANLTARISGLAPPGTVVVSDAIAPLIHDTFEIAARPALPVKGVDGLIDHYQVLGERLEPTRIPLGPLVGRQAELTYLKECWAAARASRLTTPGVAFFGEPGIGKSRLATAAADLAEHSGAVVLPLLGSPFHTTAGLHPVRTLLERRCGIGRLTEHGETLRLLEAELRRLSLDPSISLPLLAPVLGIAAEHGYQPVQAEGAKLYELVADGVLEYLIACLGDGPGLILVEDMHWFDSSTLDVVKALLNSEPRRLLVVLTGRDDTKLPSVANVELFDLKPLSDQETDELIVALDPHLSAGKRATVRQRCDGVPLYIEEVVTQLGHAATDESGWARVPDALYEPLFARLRARTNTVSVVAAAATIGRDVDRGLLLSVLDLSEADVDDVMGELEDALVFEPVGDDAWRFRHELLREVACELAPPSVRRTLHGRVADTLVDGSGDGAPDWSLVAVHYDAADRFDEAATAYQKAAADARRRGALDEARTYLGRSIAQVERMSPGPQRDRREIELRLRRGFLASAAEGTSSHEAAADFERCLQLTGSGLSDELLSTFNALYGYYATRADLRRAAQLIDSIRVGLKPAQGWFEPLNDAAASMVAWYRGDFGSALAGLEAVAASDVAARELESRWFMPNEAIASIYTHLAAARFVVGDFAGAEAGLAQTTRRIGELSFPQGPYSHAYARSYEAWMRIEAGQLDRASEVVGDLAAQAERHGFDAWILIGATQQATVNSLSSLSNRTADPSELETSIATMAALLDTWRELGVRMFLTFYDSVIARLLAAVGRTEEARGRLDAALELAEDTSVHFYDAELLRLRAHSESDSEARHAGLRAAIELARRQGATAFELRSALNDFELIGEPARSSVADAISRFPAHSTWPELARARALLG